MGTNACKRTTKESMILQNLHNNPLESRQHTEICENNLLKNFKEMFRITSLGLSNQYKRQLSYLLLI